MVKYYMPLLVLFIRILWKCESTILILYPFLSLTNHDPRSFIFEYTAEMNQMRYVQFGFQLSSINEIKPWSYQRFVCEVIDVTRTSLTGRSHNLSLLIPQEQLLNNELYVHHLFPPGIYDVNFLFEDKDHHRLTMYDTIRFELRIALHVAPPSQVKVYKEIDNIKMQITVNMGVGSYHQIEFDVKSHRDWVVNIGKFCSIGEIKVFLARSKNHRRDFITTFPLHFMSSHFSAVIDEVVVDNSHTVSIGNDVWIGNDVVLIDNITIGNGAIIGAHSVVRENVPNYAIVYGNPARVIKYRFSDEIIVKLLDMAWWDWDIDRIYGMSKYSTVDEVVSAWEQGHI